MLTGGHLASWALHILMISCAFSTMSYFFLKLSGVGSCANSLVCFLPGLSKQIGEVLQLWVAWEHLAPAFFAALEWDHILLFRTLDQVSCDICLHAQSILKRPRIPCCSVRITFPSLLGGLCCDFQLKLCFIDFSILSESLVDLVSSHGCGLMTGESCRSSTSYSWTQDSTLQLRVLLCFGNGLSPQFILNCLHARLTGLNV